VIDEVAGMCISLLWIPATPLNIFIGLVLFRFFDILKPLFIRKLEALPGGWGVMFDDVLAGIYANIILQIFIRL
jgi:phosphatidylglycerophosphatase A